MKDNLRRVNTLLKMLKDIEPFYSITIGRYDNRLQGEFNSNLIKELQKFKFNNMGFDDNGFVWMKRDYINILLT